MPLHDVRGFFCDLEINVATKNFREDSGKREDN